MTKRLQFFALLACTLLGMGVLRWSGVLNVDWPQAFSVAIFSTCVYATLLFSELRLAFAAGGIALLMACNLLSVPQLIRSANLAVIIFLVGTFLVVGFLEENLFFEHVVGAIVRVVGKRPRTLCVVLVLTATVTSALVGEVASTLFMAGAVLHLCDRYKLTPLPFVMMIVFAVNCGSAASSVGPIGVTIALRAHLSFGDFLRWAAPIALAASLASFALCRWWFAAAFRAFEAAVIRGDTGHPAGTSYAPEADAAYDQGLDQPTGARARACWLVLGSTVLLFVSHAAIERALGLERDTMLVAAALFMGAVVLLLRGRGARQLLERRVDWWTLAFFMMLFAAVGTLEQTGVTRLVADRLRSSAGANPVSLIQIVGWSTGLLSAFLDNLLAVASFLPVVDQIRGNAPYPQAVYWMMLFGGTFMGNMTVIGSTANIIACGMLEKRGHGPVRFADWLKIGVPVSIVSMLLATVLLGLQTGWFRHPLIAADR
jgi:Na+/H+ antiporter NhaD/arsenite permease-like protein